MNLDVAPQVRARLRLVKMRMDKCHAREMRRFLTDSMRKSYVASRGLQLDDVGELLWDAGLTTERPDDATSILAALECVLHHKSERKIGVDQRVAWFLSDGKPHTRRDIRIGLSLGQDVCIGSAIRRLRSSFRITKERLRGSWAYRAHGAPPLRRKVRTHAST
jgi:hypothetical protein